MSAQHLLFLMSAALAACGTLAAGPAFAADENLRIELNRLEPQGENCRAYLLVENKASEGFRSLKLDLFAFDTDGVAARRLGVEIGPVAGRKTLVKLFDFPGLACPRFGRILLNDVITCDTGTGPRDQCLDLIAPGSRVGAVAFVK